MRVAVVGTFDLTRGTEVAGFDEAVAQWAASHRIVATKTDLVPPDVIVDLPSAIEAVNPLAEVIPGVDRGSAVLAAFAPLTSAPPLREIGPDRGRAHPRVALCLAKPAREVAFSDLAAWLDNLAGALGERLLRIKGLVRVNESEPAAADRKRRHDVLAAAPAERERRAALVLPRHHCPRCKRGRTRTGRARRSISVVVLEKAGRRAGAGRPPRHQGGMGRVIA